MLQLELDSLKMEYANAQLECNAADERAKLLASEVIGLEEKVVYICCKSLWIYLRMYMCFSCVYPIVFHFDESWNNCMY